MFHWTDQTGTAMFDLGRGPQERRREGRLPYLSENGVRSGLRYLGPRLGNHGGGNGKGRGEVAAGPRLAFLLIVATSLIFTGASANKSQKYKVHESVPLFANKVGPFNNPSETYQYYSLPFCKPKDGEKYKVSRSPSGRLESPGPGWP